MSWRIGALVLAMACTGLSVGAALDPPDVVPVGIFSEMDPSQALPDGWKKISLAAAYPQSEYDLVRSDRGVVIRARANESTGGLGTNLRVDLANHPILEWTWKVERTIPNGNVAAVDRGDTPARIVVTFDYRDLSLPHRLRAVTLRALGYDAVPKRAIIYLWANQGTRYRVIPNPYIPWIEQVAVQSGSTHVGTWQTERRNVRADYRRIFGEEPPPVERIVLMTDANNTNSETTAYFGDILFRAAAPDSATADTTLHMKTGDSE